MVNMNSNQNKKVKVIVLRAAGTNCDIETKFGFDYLGANTDLIHINKLISSEIKLKDYHILAIPGGFTYGDDISAGKIMAVQLIYTLKHQIKNFIEEGKLIIGICNGFQVLVKAGILPGNEFFTQQASLTLNDSGKFEDRWVYLESVTSNQLPVTRERKCVWAKGIKDIIYLPVAHAEGKFIPQNRQILQTLKENNQIVFQYATKEGKIAKNFPENPNGSVEAIAGICDGTGRILGMMPHPERNILFHHHPHWTRKPQKHLCDGVKILENGIEYVKENLL